MRKALRPVRAQYRQLRDRIFPKPHLPVAASGQAAGDLIRAGLESGQPFMAARLGRVELEAILPWYEHQIGASSSWVRTMVERLRGQPGQTLWSAKTRFLLENNAGFFPAEPAYLERFAQHMLADVSEINILGSWLPGEVRLRPCFPTATIIPLVDLEPYYHARPWSAALEGKTVLVIHPFATTIRQQYARREALFANPQMLPPFELKIIQAVQSMGGKHPDYPHWFAALEDMQARIAATPFDVALIGAGAYGLPLAAFVKRSGRQAIHLGGATQILFGIRGRRWEERPFFAQMMNDAWVHPLPEERPENYQKVENGCYW